MVKSKTIIATPPGATIKEQLENRGMTQKEFADRMGMTPKHICNLIAGEVRLTPSVALRLESVLGISAEYWNRLETIYQEKRVRADEENAMDEDAELIKNFPYNEMKKLKWVSETNIVADKVISLRNFFEVFRLSCLNERLIPGIAYRKLSVTEKSDIASICWTQKAKLEARRIETKDINIAKLKDSIPTFREMTCLSPSVFCPKLIETLASCGVAVVFLPHIKGSFLQGATFYDGKKIVMGLTVRGKDADKFWFSFFHELAHIIYGHIGKTDGANQDDEKGADEFARNTLIPEEDFTHFVDNCYISKPTIVNFAKQMKVDPGIVVGRLQKEGFILYSQLNDLKKQYVIAEPS